MRSSVDVVIPTLNTREMTRACVDSVLHVGRASSLRLRCVVVDNGSDDGTVDALADLADVEVLRNDENVGYGRACNQGARAGTGTYILILNSDIVAGPDAIQRLVDFLDDRRDHVACGGRLVDAKTGRPQIGLMLRAYPTLSAQAALMLGLERLWPTNPVSRRQLMLDFDYDSTQSVNAQPAGACLMCRRETFDAVGGFDESFYYWFEDVDLVLRLSRVGRIGYAHDSIFEHSGAGTFRQWSRPEVVVTRYRSLLLYFDKHHSRHEVIVLRALVAGLAVLRMIPLLALNRRRAFAYASVFGLAIGKSS